MQQPRSQRKLIMLVSRDIAGIWIVQNENNVSMPIAKFIQLERTRRGITRSALGNKAGVAHPGCLQVETGKSKSFNLMAELLGALGYSLRLEPRNEN